MDEVGSLHPMLRTACLGVLLQDPIHQLGGRGVVLETAALISKWQGMQAASRPGLEGPARMSGCIAGGQWGKHKPLSQCPPALKVGPIPKGHRRASACVRCEATPWL
jgi:hypothetical protein